MTEINPTAANTVLATNVNKRIAADSTMLYAKASIWRMGGVGLLGLGLGAGVGLAFLGYSYIADASSSAEKIALAFQTALERITLKTEGDLGIKDGEVVALADGSKVAIDPNGNKVRLETPDPLRLDPNARVRIDGVVAGSPPRPSEAQLRGTGTRATSGTVVTAYTVFKTVKFADGEVVTGWNYASSEQATPHQQYCYFGAQLKDQVQLRIDLAANGNALPIKNPPAGFDAVGASALCAWFDGSLTRRTSSFDNKLADPAEVVRNKMTTKSY